MSSHPLALIEGQSRHSFGSVRSDVHGTSGPLLDVMLDLGTLTPADAQEVANSARHDWAPNRCDSTCKPKGGPPLVLEMDTNIAHLFSASLACYKTLWELIHDPFYWDKQATANPSNVYSHCHQALKPRCLNRFSVRT